MLPVPPLEATAARYLKSLRPLLKDADFARAQNFVAEFIKDGGVGQVLQSRLENRAREKAKTGKSWLIEWWNDYAYMSYRDPVVINVSYFFVFADAVKRMQMASRAASLARGALLFRKEIYE